MSDDITSKVEGLKLSEGTIAINPQKGSDTIGEALQLDGNKIPFIDMENEKRGEATILDDKNIPFIDMEEKSSDDSTLIAKDNKKLRFAEIFDGETYDNEDLSDLSDVEGISDYDSDEQDAEETTIVGAKGTESKETGFKIPYNVKRKVVPKKETLV
ncbi:hypothetical protein BDAP_000658 [Binucleata daphniae]